MEDGIWDRMFLLRPVSKSETSREGGTGTRAVSPASDLPGEDVRGGVTFNNYFIGSKYLRITNLLGVAADETVGDGGGSSEPEAMLLRSARAVCMKRQRTQLRSGEASAERGDV